jgi:hypothetical protein
MDVSNIKEKEYTPSRREADDLIHVTAQYISAWTHREFHRLVHNQKLPLIWNLSNGGYIIGKLQMNPEQGCWTVKNTHGELVHRFDTKQSAIFYCLTDQTKYSSIALSIKSADATVLKLKNDIVHYTASLLRAEQQRDIYSSAVWSSRLEDAQLKLQLSTKELVKYIEQAKNLKIWQQ